MTPTDAKAKFEEAKKNMARALKQRWPSGTHVRYTVRHGQKVPSEGISEGKVPWHNPEYLCVTADTGTQRLVHWSKILDG